MAVVHLVSFPTLGKRGTSEIGKSCENSDSVT